MKRIWLNYPGIHLQPSNPGETDNSAQRNEDQGQRGDTEPGGCVGGFRQGRLGSQRRKEPETTISPFVFVFFDEIKTKTIRLVQPPSVRQQSSN